MSFFTDQREEVFGYPADPCEFCKKLRQDPEMNRRCICCDQQALDVVDGMQGVYIYDCHAGLTEAIVAFRHHGRSTGYLMIGQFLSGHAVYPENYPAELRGPFLSQTMLDPPRIRAAADIMEACVGYILYRDWFHALADTPAQRIQRYIERHYAERITLDSMAQAVYMSRSTLCQYVRREMGTTVNQLIENRRIEAAKIWLATPGRSIVQTAEACGYTEANYFSRRFKRATGMTPSDYQDMVRDPKIRSTKF